MWLPSDLSVVGFGLKSGWFALEWCTSEYGLVFIVNYFLHGCMIKLLPDMGMSSVPS